MARAQLFVVFLALLILAAGVAGAAYYWKNIIAPEKAAKTSSQAKSGDEIPDLGGRYFDKAIGLLEKGELQAARETFYYLLEYYPESDSCQRARRVLGEVNMDLLVSKTPIPGKTEYVVRSGDAPTTIARKTQTTIPFLMRANAKTRTLIYKNERLSVYPLNFEIDINLADKKIVVTEKGKFFKEYAILADNLPPIVKPPVKTRVDKKVAWQVDRPVTVMQKEYLSADKWIQTGKSGLFIRSETGKKGEKEETKKFGVLVAKPDIEELFTIIRNGSPVRLNP